jgi:hypothetical protein
MNLPVYYLIRGWFLQGLCEVRLGWNYSRYDLFRLRFYFSHCIHRRRMRTSQNTAFAVHDRCDTLYGGYKSDAGVGSGRRRWFLDLYGFRFSTTLWNVYQPPFQLEPGALSLGIKQLGREADHLPPSSAEVKGAKLYLHSPNTPSWRGAQLKHRDNFTFTFYLIDAWNVYNFCWGRFV